MAELEEAVLVKAHLRRTGKKQRKDVDISDLVVFGILFGLVAATIYFLFEWVKAGGWILLSSGLLGFCIVFSLIRWRKHIFQKRVWTASAPKSLVTGAPWQKMSRDDYPLWLLHNLYDLRYRRKIRRDDYTINGRAWQYYVVLKDPSIAEPVFSVDSLTISKRLR